MNHITEITRRDIIALFRNGYKDYNFLDGSYKVHYNYFGRLPEIEFLRKSYPLDKMPSNDPKFDNAQEDIWQHTVNNDDWTSDWIFTDDRFELRKGSDIIWLKFLCAVFHPENREEAGHWKEYLDKINNLIRIDGYELYESEKISDRAVYSWRKLTIEEIAHKGFLPFSLRHKSSIESKSLKLPTISKRLRTEIINLFNQYNETQYRTDETNWNYSITSKEAVIEDLRAYYTPKAFDEITKNYSETTDLDSFVMSNFPHCVFDAIELFVCLNNHNNFVDEINFILRKNGYPYKLLGGKFESEKIDVQIKEIAKEPGLRELIEQAMTRYRRSDLADKQIAVEKLWDAFERLKTYYGSGKQKSASAERVVNEIAKGEENYRSLFNEEFQKLTQIGNSFRIRHHEIDKIEIADNDYYDYFFQRCFVLINLALKYLK
jgi:hypothetical protein